MFSDIVKFFNNRTLLNISYIDIVLLNYYQIGSKALISVVKTLNRKITTKKITKIKNVKKHVQVI
jgi:hypothetical protein